MNIRVMILPSATECISFRHGLPTIPGSECATSAAATADEPADKGLLTTS
jgi:hypothetical protein